MWEVYSSCTGITYFRGSESECDAYLIRHWFTLPMDSRVVK